MIINLLNLPLSSVGPSQGTEIVGATKHFYKSQKLYIKLAHCNVPQTYHPWTSTCVSTYQPSSTEYKAEILGKWEHDDWKNIKKHRTPRSMQWTLTMTWQPSSQQFQWHCLPKKEIEEHKMLSKWAHRKCKVEEEVSSIQCLSAKENVINGSDHLPSIVNSIFNCCKICPHSIFFVVLILYLLWLHETSYYFKQGDQTLYFYTYLHTLPLPLLYFSDEVFLPIFSPPYNCLIDSRLLQLGCVNSTILKLKNEMKERS